MRCKTCGIDAPTEAFYVSNKTRCKSCIKASVIANRIAKIEYYRSYDKSRASQAHRVTARKNYMQTDAGRAAHQKAVRKHIKLNPEKYRARQLIGNAVRDGKVTPLPCLACGCKAEAHHPDYSMPLDVVWLCPAHHKQSHAETKRALLCNTL